MPKKAGPTLYLIDGHSLTFKAYYAVRGLTSPKGQPTGAVFGFLRMLLKFLDDYAPQALAVVFDTGKPTFRSEIYADYKANRDAPPPDFGLQMDWIYKLLRTMEIAVYEHEGFEADDVIATMAEQAKSAGRSVVILSADKDLFQLVDQRVTMLRPGLNGMQSMTATEVEQRLGVRPDQVVDWLALVGDSSDNVPGVPGIGQKSATALLGKYANLDALIQHASEIPNNRQREALTAHAETARLARRLVEVRRDVPVRWQLEDCAMPSDLWPPPVVGLMVELGFNSILTERAVDVPADLRPSGVKSAEQIQSQYQVIGDERGLQRWVDEARQAPWVALDTETTSTDVMRAELVGISLSHRQGHAIYIPVGHLPENSPKPQLTVEVVRRLLAPLLAPEGPKLSGHHAKFDWKILRRAGFDPAPPAFDTMIASYLLNPDKPSGHGLKTLGLELVGVEMRPISDLIGRGSRAITMAQVNVEEAGAYACLDADVTLRLTEKLAPELQADPALRHLMEQVELPLISVLVEMELGGFTLDADVLGALGVEVGRRLGQVGKQIWTEAGHPFNIASPKQVAKVLYEELGLKPGKKGKTGYSTAEAELERLAPEHPVARIILEYRGYEKLQSTYIDALPRMVCPSTGRIHTSFNQTIAATGRLSSTDPNLQNIPIRTEMGRSIRRAFVADHANQLLLKADYSQIELRILAHVSQDATLCAAYRERRDIHNQTACEVFGVAPEAVTDQMRAEAKVINFGIIYGMSPHGLATQLGIGRERAAEFINRYFNTYPGVREWIELLLAQARRDGWVRTLMGRRRLVPALNEKNRMVREAAERVAVNTPIQGTCADMIKVAMIRIDRGLNDVAPAARMVCQVHDELVFSVPEDRLDATGEFVRRQMVEALPLSVPVEVDLGSGPNWAEC